MQIKNIAIFDSTNAVNGNWIDISNLVSLSIQVVGLESNVWIEVSNDPNVQFNGPNFLGTPATPVLTQIPYGALTNQGTYFVKTTYVTRNGETLPSAGASIAVNDGHVLCVAPPLLDLTGIAISYNVYVGKTSGAETLHYGPNGNNQPNIPFVFYNGVSGSGIGVPALDTSGGPGIGINLTGDLSTGKAPVGMAETGLFYNSPGSASTSAMFNPSSLSWRWLRVCKLTGSSVGTTAFLMGQNG